MPLLVFGGVQSQAWKNKDHYFANVLLVANRFMTYPKVHT